MPTINTVREFVINSLKQYHEAQISAEAGAISTALADYVSYTKANSYYVAKETGKGLSTNDFTTTYMTKLDGIAEGAEVNVNADWDASSGDAQILHKPNIAGLFGYAYYDTTNHRISFSYSSTSAELYNIDCSTFIVDGMIDNVAIKNYSAADQATNGTSYLFIDFNTAAENGGHTDIKIPLKDIFNPNNYYDKTTADSTFVKQGQETTLSLGTAAGSGNVISSISVNGHEITPTYTSVLTADSQEAISMSGTKGTAGTNKTMVVTDIAASGTKNHTLTVSYTEVISTETQLSLSGSAPSAAGTGYANVISQLGVSNHAITPTYVKVITEHQSLTDYATKEFVGNTYLTKAVAASTYVTHTSAASSYVAKEEGKGLSTNDFTDAYETKLSGIETGAEVNAIETITLNGGSALTIDANRNVNIQLPAAATVSFTGTKSADAGDYTYVANSFSANDHQITVSYTGVLKQHQDISGKEDSSNKKDAIIGNEASSTYYPSTKAIATYVGSLAELSSSELGEIFGKGA